MCARKRSRELSLAQLFPLRVLNDGLPWALQAGGIASVALTVNPAFATAIADCISSVLGKGYGEPGPNKTRASKLPPGRFWDEGCLRRSSDAI